MDTTTVPPMKPVLVESVSDDIRTLLQGDVLQQKTLLTARAIADLYKCAKISKSNPSDTTYFTGDKVDLNKITVACSRALTKDQYINGPSPCGSFKTVDGYAVNESGQRIIVDKNNASQKKEFNYSGFLYVYGVLADGSLTWANYDGATPIDETKDQKTQAQPLSPMIRQVFWADTGDGTNSNHTPWTRVGTLQGGTSYTWGEWYVAGYRHNGPEYFNVVNITSNMLKIDTPAVDTIYHIYSRVDSIVLPNANLNLYQNGQKITFMMHPPLTASGTSMATISYVEKKLDGTETDNGEMSVIATPFIVKNTSDPANPRPADMGVAEFTFEITDLLDNSGTKIGRTWELASAVEETDYLSGLCQLLEQHTELGSGDLVAYSNRKYKGEVGASETSIDPTSKLEIEYTAPVHGFVILDFVKPTSIVDDLWSAKIQVVKGTTTTTIATIKLTDLLEGVALRKAKFLDKGDVLAITITPGARSGQGHKYYRDTVQIEPMVLFYPDAHDGYLHQAYLNNKAFAYHQIQTLQDSGAIPLKDGETVLDNTPVASRALAEAYTYLAQHVQNRGMLLGVVKQDNLGYFGLDTLTSDGMYWARLNHRYDDVTHDNSWPVGPTVAMNGIHVLTITNRRAGADLVHEDQFITTDPDESRNNFHDKDYVMQIAFDFDESASVFIRVAYKTGSNWDWEDWSPVGLTEADVNRLIDLKIKDSDGNYLFALRNHNHNLVNILNPNVEADLIDSDTPIVSASNISILLEEKEFPVLLVGIKDKVNTSGDPNKIYEVNIEMPDAVAKLTDVNAKRRKVRFLFHGNLTSGFKKISFRLHYKGLDTTKTYSYERVWTPEHTIKDQESSYLNGGSYIQLDFEQMNTPGDYGECLWAPVEVG